MAPVAISSPTVQDPISLIKQGITGTDGQNKHANDDVDVLEDYSGEYRFAPIEEAQVSRAMIKR
jgi:thiamine thiazole synthase